MSNKLRTHGKGVVVWILLGVMVLGLGGFGISSFTGGSRAIGSVGDTDITLNDYALAMRQAVSAAQNQLGRPVSMNDAKALGIDRQVEGQLFAEATMAEDARRLGLSVGDAEIAAKITTASAFQGPDGKFDGQLYRMALRQQGLTPNDFETRLRADIARSVLQGAVASGVNAPTPLVSAYAAYITESRPLAWVEVTDAALPAQPGAPSAADLQAYYDGHDAAFTRPETRNLSYVWLTPDMLRDAAKPDEATLRAIYDQRIDEYRQPERRLVDKLVFPSEDDAKAARTRLDAGQISFEDLARERGLDITDIDLGEATRADLGASADAIFALGEPGVVGPLPTDLGPALFKVNGILPAEETSFEDASPDLAAESTLDRARRMISDKTAALEDELASGATLEELAKADGMQLGQIAMTPDSHDGIAAYEAFRDTANAAQANDFPELHNLDDGGVFALRLDGVTASAKIPFDEVKSQVEDAWRQAEFQNLRTKRAEEIVAAFAAGKTLADQGLQVNDVAPVERTGFVEGLPPALVQSTFTGEPGKALMVNNDGRTFVLIPGTPVAADPADPEIAALNQQLAQRIAQSLSTDLATLYAAAKQGELKLKIDSTAITAVQAQMQ